MVKIRRKLVVNKPRKWGSVVVRVPWSRLIQSAKYDVNQWIMLIDKEMWDPNDPGAPSVQWDTIACLNELKRKVRKRFGCSRKGYGVLFQGKRGRKRVPNPFGL